MKRFIIALIASAAVILGLTACDPTDTTNAGASETHDANSGPKWVNQDGTYKVGSGADEIPAGTYNVRAGDNAAAGGYVELCRDAACEIGAGLISNELVPAGGNAFIEVPADAAYVKLMGVVVEAA